MDEYWDLLDYNGNLLPQKMLRGTKQPESTWHAVVGIVIQNSKGEILTIKRASTKEQYPDMWEHIGGCVKAGEQIVDAACREVQEANWILLDSFLNQQFKKEVSEAAYGRLLRIKNRI